MVVEDTVRCTERNASYRTMWCMHHTNGDGRYAIVYSCFGQGRVGSVRDEMQCIWRDTDMRGNDAGEMDAILHLRRVSE